MNEQARTDETDQTEKQRTNRTTIANIRQQFQAPAQALAEYSELLLRQACDYDSTSMLSDLKRVSGATRQMTSVVDQLLSEEGIVKLNDEGGTFEAERLIRHELRTPINAIKGYAEMLLEDLIEFGAQSMEPDLIKLLSLANDLLTDINTYVHLEPTLDQSKQREIDAVSAAVSSKLVKNIQAIDCKGGHCPTEPVETSITGHILIVDDIQANRDLLVRRLESDGHNTACAVDGRDALKRLHKTEFDLVLLDLMMPDLNGYEVLTQIRQEPKLRNIPVIMVSALDENDSLIRCIEAGAIDYLQKPINPTLLKARIKSGLLNKRWSDDERDQRRFIKRAFSKFVSPAVVNQMVERPEKLRLGGERVEITCVFTDLSGFTHAIEDAEPTDIMPVLNNYLSKLCEIAMQHDGTIDKIIGDAVYIFFNAPVAKTDHPEAAVACALAIEKWSNQFILSQEAKKFGFGRTRIGVHTGNAIVGNFGGDAFFNYTAYGDTVNTTARLESANKKLGTSICVSSATASRCSSFSFRPIGKLLLKGKAKPVDAHTLTSSEDYKPSYIEAYSEAVSTLDNQGSSSEAKLVSLLSEKPNDPLCRFHLERLRAGNASGIIIINEQ